LWAITRKSQRIQESTAHISDLTLFFHRFSFACRGQSTHRVFAFAPGCISVSVAAQYFANQSIVTFQDLIMFLDVMFLGNIMQYHLPISTWPTAVLGVPNGTTSVQSSFWRSIES
jgi:hypothetical protein